MRRLCRWMYLVMLLVAPLAHGASVKVQVEGVSDKPKANVLAMLAIAQVQGQSDLTAGRIRYLNAQAPAQIRRALEPFGYYRAQVKTDLKPGPQEWTATYRIEPGPPIPVIAVNLQLSGPGRTDPALEKAVKSFPIRKGDPLDQPRYEQAKGGLQQRALALGYLDARYTEHQLRLDLRAYEARVVLTLATGPRYRFGPVTFSGSALSPKFLHEYLPFSPGDPYSSARLLALQQALQNSDYFKRVDIQPQRDRAKDQEVPIEVKLEPRKRHKYTFGLGYGTDTGPRASVGWEHRRINSLGHKMQAQYRISRIYQELSLRYIIPLAHPATDQLAITAATRNETVNDQVSKTRLIGVSRLVTHGTVQQTLSLNYQHETFSVGDTSGVSRLLIPGFNWTRISADDRIYTRRGSRLSLDLRGALQGVASDTSFVRADLGAKIIRSFGSDNRIIARAEVGAIQVPDFSVLPVSLRFFAGGDHSVRGYAYNSLGPVDASGTVVGGQYLMVGSVEYDRHIVGKWGAAVFYDAGNAFDIFPTHLHRGAGVGVRWRSPVGMVRVDLAAALSKEGHPLRLHISIGPDL
ncbi:MAG: autotransporter assembly complex family protein [Gammaproteobacteria bacterium]